MSAHSSRRPAPSRPSRLDRLAFADGAAVLSRDLDDLAAYEARLLGLHVRALHDAAGVADGLRLSLAADGRSVTVAAGAAYTACGEVVTLHRPVTIAGPRRTIAGDAPARFLLALAAPAPDDAWPCERPPRCTGAPPPRRVPTLRWVPARPAAAAAADALRPREDVVLGAVLRRPDGTLAALDYADRRGARPMSRPHIGFGAVDAGALLWSPAGFPLRAYIDTRSAAFSATPAYLVAVGAIAGLPATLVGPFASVEQPTASGFTVRLLFANRPAQTATAVAELVKARLAGVAIRWTGLETARGCSSTGGTP